MKRGRRKKPGTREWFAAIVMVAGLFALTGEEQWMDELRGLLPTAAASSEVAGTASVIDGDTLDIHGTRIRLHGIDAPEGQQTCGARGRTWRCGQQAALALSDRIGRRPVTCRQRDTDRYGRVVATCHQGDTNLNAWMVRQGWAVAYRQYGRDYIADEDAAKAAGRGIWAGPFMMPWDWRRRQG
ncbi:thermonuclease family protein [Cereibacter sp. SYSU M97828]|nr:thermonuclease family protein [Cereibacter flavus]